MVLTDLTLGSGGAPPCRVLLIPAFNEERHLPRVLEQVFESVTGFEVVVVDDGSQDGTSTIAARAGARVLRHPFNLGYGAALQTGYKYALQRGATLIVQMDADAQHDPREIPRLIEPVERGELDLVIGSRFLGSGSYRMGLAKSTGRKLFRTLAHVFGLSVSDPTSGFQAMNRKVMALYANDFFPSDYPDIDVLLAAHRHGIRIGDRAVTMAPGLRGSSLHRGFAVLYYVYKMLLSIWATAVRARDDGAIRRDGAP